MRYPVVPSGTKAVKYDGFCSKINDKTVDAQNSSCENNI